jgi:alpha-galactosidase
MSDARFILRLESATVDVVIKTHPFAEISTGGRIFSTFRRRMLHPRAPVANGRLDVDSPVTLMAELGHACLGRPGLRGIGRGWTVPRCSNHEVQQEANPDDYR